MAARGSGEYSGQGREYPIGLGNQQGYSELVELLLGLDAHVHKGDKQNRTALILAATSGHLELTEMLLERGYEIDAEDASGNTPLIAAARAAIRKSSICFWNAVPS